MKTLSRHAVARAAQRGIPLSVLGIIMESGTSIPRPGNATEVRLTKHDKNHLVSTLKRILHEVERAADKALLVSEDGIVITTYHCID